MTRRSLFTRLGGLVATMALVPAIQAGPIWPKVTVAAGWGSHGYTDWSDGIRRFKPPVQFEPDILFGQILPVARYYGLPVQSVLDMPFQTFHRYLDAVPREVLFS